MFIAALSIAAKKWKQPKCLSIDGWINKFWSIQTMDYYAAIKRNEIQIHPMMGMKLGNMILSERSQTQKATYCMSPIL